MNDSNVSSRIPSSFSVKEYFVPGKSGAGQVVKMSFNPGLSTTMKTTIGSGESASILINIGTKNMTDNADVSKAISHALISGSADTMVESAIQNIANNPEQAVQAASNISNADAMGLLF